MIARVLDTEQGFIVVIPPEYAKAWCLREGFPLEVQRVGHTSEQDEPDAIAENVRLAVAAFEKTLPAHEAVYRELAKGPEGLGPHDPLPFDGHKG
jgi:hypothetical protein